ncbi:ATP-binding cassette domain-containing protein [Pelomonas sp. PFR6]|uniref:ATP-binding cassette domain-containing protein n=1 Tax=Roseateles violae TaxID=3058042 RepID=A0ABT8DM32_9BURK|nr:ATP-binding cassette domain-containing protein [Pelomonas sp. PFR6]MDN3919466.1 ATP-binding cassette domain-containing protein [Pelomonas sp. PFR6]
MAEQAPLLRVEGLSRSYALPRQSLFRAPPRLQALQDIAFQIEAGQCLGVIGESGSGKSTLARAVLALDRPQRRHDAGRVLLKGQDLQALDAKALRRARQDMQMVFQDPYASLDPRMSIGRIVAEPLAALHGGLGPRGRHERVRDSLEAVGLRAADMNRYPHEFSGGQRQRIAIARALVSRPKLIVADEPVSALDVSIQAQVLNLMQELARQYGLAYLLISHDLAVVDHLADQVLVLYQGRIVERGTPAQVFGAPEHPYTRRLVAAMP